MGWIFGAFVVISVMHMCEEYFYPGGFMDILRRLNPQFAPSITVPMAVIFNGLQLLLCIGAIVIGKRALTFSMSIAGLLFTNGLMHIIGCLRIKRYAPGVVTGVLLYIPLSLYAYYIVISSGLLTPNRVIVTVALGLLYQTVPISYLALAKVIRRP